MAEAEVEATEAAAEEATQEGGDFSALLQKEFKPKSDRAKEAVENAVKTLAEQALADTALISGDAVKSIEAMIAEIDKRLTDQVNLVLHHADFQKLEGSWRGMHHLVNNTETDEMLKIRVLNISKKDVHKNLKNLKGLLGIRAHYLRKFMSMSTVSLAESLLVVWWVTMNLITHLLM